VVVAGGSICTSFPDFASQFFDVVCAGGVDSVPAVVADFLNGSLKAIYRSPITRISPYAIDYSLLTKSRINPSVHLIEASRGCSFKCSFCVIPSEVGAHAIYDFDQLAATIDNAISKKSQVVVIAPTDATFKTRGCQAWALTDEAPPASVGNLQAQILLGALNGLAGGMGRAPAGPAPAPAPAPGPEAPPTP